MTKLFVGFNFTPEGLLSRKVTGFRKRFDPKYNQYGFPHMAMLAPFEIHDNDVVDLTETLKEELDSFFYDNKTMPRLDFAGIGVYEHNKKKLLYLNPNFDIDLGYCSEVVLEICKSFIPKTIRYKENARQFLPLGIFYNMKDMFEVMEHAKVEFENNSPLPIESISLYEKKFGIWVEKEVLVSFVENETHFLQMNHATL